MLVCLTDSRGAWGLGEAAPLPGYSRDELDDVGRALAALSPDSVGHALDAEDTWSALAAVAELLPSALPSARFALESAALDLLARRRDLSAPALLGAAADASRPLSALLGAAASPQLLSEAERAFAAGYRCFKLKVGAPDAFERELDGAAALRARFGGAVALRLDANGALSADALSSAAGALRALELDLFEEPGAELPAGVPLALDESLQGVTVNESETIWQRRSARALVLKPTALGGLAHARQLAERALRSGLAVSVSHAFEGPVAWRAAAALALTLPVGVPHGLAPYPALSSWPGDHLPVASGALHAWSEPGLGYPLELAFP